MARSKFRDLLQELRNATGAGNVRWQETAEEGTFRVGLGDGIVRIQPVKETLPAYSVLLINRKGQTIDEMKANKSDYPAFTLLDELYKSARLSALDVDRVIESMIDDIRSGRSQKLPPETGIIGNDPFK